MFRIVGFNLKVNDFSFLTNHVRGLFLARGGGSYLAEKGEKEVN